MKRLACAAALVLAGCPDGTIGTVDVSLITAPGSTVLDSVTKLRVTLTDPHQVVEATRDETGFAVALEVDANGEAGAVIVEGFDGAGNRIVAGESPPFSVNPIDAAVKVYVAPPLSIGPAPTSLAAARRQIAATPLAYGAALVGGTLTDDAPSAAVQIYNAYDHSLTDGLALPTAGAIYAIASGTNGSIFFVQGRDVRRFDTTTAPSGSYSVTAETDLAATATSLTAIGDDRFLATAAMPFIVASRELTPRADLALESGGASLTTANAKVVAIVAAGGTLARFTDDTLTPISGAAAGADPVFAALPNDQFLVQNSNTVDVRKVDATTGAVSTVAGALSIARSHPHIAATERHVLVVSDGTADILDATTLARLATVPVTTGGFAVALPNEQILLGGGVAAASNQLELFTPPPPPTE